MFLGLEVLGFGFTKLKPVRLLNNKTLLKTEIDSHLNDKNCPHCTSKLVLSKLKTQQFLPSAQARYG
jgi:DNA-directed RNA polymerase subunit RPC12/RpoP